MGSQRAVSNREREEPDTRLFMAQYNRMEFNVPREHSFATTSTRSRCEYLMRNNGLVNDWNTVVEQLLTAHPKVVKKKKKKEQKDDKNAQIKILVERIEEDQQHRQKILEDHSLLESQMSHMNNQLEGEKEKTRKTLKLAYLLRLEIAKQKTMIAEQQSVIQGSDAKIDTVKVDMQNHVKEEVKDVRDELKKF